ncbi:right-handed parallel beta-helix repeat-containing protein [Halobacteria archaeon AArc-curdl1]|uniref:Right-handed parallel beta-helix repeat-containing protein n=1 Tax=Natronosalvus hydrolyticus TaxID=2979988 RepID=A0AAP2ZAF9_9EURY|nr:right-handed parallel beta-helix repeat-containing protein [Halobacteria archaeon AArc-curdl1]
MITSVIAPAAAASGVGVDEPAPTESALGSLTDTSITQASTDDDSSSTDSEGGDDSSSSDTDSSESTQGSTIAASDASCDVTVESGESIQSAIANATWGETVCVESGTYEEDLWIDTGGLTLVANGDVTLVPDDETWTGVYVNSSAVTLEGFEIRDFTRGVHVASETSNVEIRDNHLTANDVGVHLSEVTGTVIDGNTITANNENGIVFNRFSPQEGVEITNNTITHNEYSAIVAAASVGSNGASGTLVSGNTISNNTGTTSSPAITFRRSSDTTVVDNDIQHDGQIAIDFREYSSDALIERNTVTNTSRGIHLGDVSSIEIRDNDIEGLSASAIWMRDSSSIDIVDNRLDANGQGITSGGLDTLLVENNTVSSEGSDLSLSSTTDATVRDNAFAHGVAVSSGTNEQEREHFLHEFDGNTVGGGALVYVRDADGVTIDPSTYPDAGQIIVANTTDVEISNFELSDTVAAIQLGATEGTIVAHNTIANGIEGEKGGIIDMGSTGSVIEHNDVSTVQYGIQLVGGSESIVRNNTVSDTRGSHQAYTFGIHLERHGEDHVVRDNTVTGSYSDGIQVHNTHRTLVEGNTLVGNDRHGLQIRWGAEDSVVRDNQISGNSDNGIHLYRADRTIVEGNDVSENTRGIVAGRNTEDLLIEGNTVTDNSRQGIQLEPPGSFTSGDAPYNATILENEIADNGRDGILLDEAAAATVTGNTITNNGYINPSLPSQRFGDGIELRDAIDATVEGNTIEGSVVDGIDVGAGSINAILSHNTITDSGDRGIYVDAENATLRDNSIVDNPEGVVSGGEEVDARFNWWGAVSGPSGGVSDPVNETTASGSGDSVSTNVRFHPWMVSEPVDDAPHFAVSITETNSPVTAGETLTVDVTVENTGTEPGTQTISLEALDGSVVDELEDLALDPDENHTVTLTWETDTTDAGSGAVTVHSDDDDATAAVSIAQDGPVTITESTVITAPGTYLLDTNLTDDTTAIEITSSDVVFDGQGHTITGIDDASDGWEYGVYVNGSAETLTDVTVRNVTVTGWRQGIRYRGANDGSISDVVTEYNSGGFVILGANDNAITNVTARHNDNTGVSVGSLSVGSTVRNTFTNVTAYDNGGVGIRMDSGSSNDFVGANASSNQVGIETWGTGNTFTDVTATDNSQHGLNLRGGGSVGNTFDTVNVSRNGNGWTGIRINSNGNTLSNITATENGGTSIYLVGSLSGGASVTGNELHSVTVTDTEQNSIGLSNAANNQFTDVTLVNTSNNAIDIRSGSTLNTFTGLTILDGDSNAVYLGPDGHDNMFTDVTISGNQGGMSLFGDGTTVTNLTAEDIGGTAISVSGSAADSVVSDVSVSNVSTGVGMFGTPTNNEISNVSITDAGTGLSVSGADNHLSNVTVTNSATDVSVGPTTNTTFERIHLEGSTLSFDGQDVTINGTSAPETMPDTGYAIDAYVNVTASGDAPLLTELGFHYDEGDVDGLDEATLELWRFDESGTWESPSEASYDVGVDTDERFVYATNVTEFSTFGVFADTSPQASISHPSLSTDEVVQGESVTVTAQVTNVGLADGELTIPLEVNGEVVANETVTLDVNESETVSITHELDEPGEFDVSIDGVSVGTVNVLASADVFIYGADADETDVTLGDTLTVTADLYNGGDVPDEEYTVNLTVDGDVVDEANVTVEKGANPGLVELEWTPTAADLPSDEDSAEFDLGLDGFFVGSVTVVDQYSDIQVIAASTADTELIEGEETYVIGSIYQAGNVGGTEEIELTATHNETGETEVIGSQEVTLEPGYYHLGAINITFSPDEPGHYDLELDGRNAGWVDVEPAESDIQVIAASTADTELIEGEETHVIGSIYQAGNVGGTEEIELTATHNETGETKVVGTQNVTLEPGYYHLGAINITFTPDEPGHYDLELDGRNAGWVDVEPAESDIQVIAASTADLELIEGEETYVIGSIYQAGNIEGTEEIELTATHNVTGETKVVGTQEVTLEPGYYHLGGINITFTPDEPGHYDLQLGDRNAGSVDVEPAESDIQVIAASTADVELIEGEETYVIGSIYQAGNVEGTEEIELTATHNETGETKVVGTQNVTLEPGYYHLGALNVTFTPDEPGHYDLELGGRSAGFVEVEPAVSDIQVIAASTSDVELIEGKETHVIGSIYQAGNVEGTEAIELTATHNETGETEVVGTQNVTLEPGYYHLGAINITFTPDEPGHYDLELDGRNAGSVDVEEAVTDIQVIAASVSDVEISENEETHVIGSVYQAGNIEGTEEIELTATHEDGTETVVGTQDVTVEPGYYLLGGLNVTFEPEQTGNYTLELGGTYAGTVYVEEVVTDIQVIAASTADVELIEGEETHVIGSIYQNGSDTATEEIELTATNQETNETHVVGSQEVTAEPGTYYLGEINITFTPDEPGTYDLELGGRNAGWVEVEPAVSDIQVIAASTADVELIEGEETHVIGSIYQAGNVEGTEEIELTATHNETGETEVVGTQQVTLEPGYYHLGAINITFTPDEPGHYDLELDGRNAGWVDVEPAESDIQVIAASTADVELIEGEETYVIGSVYQAGNVEGTEEIELTATHNETGETEVIGTRNVTLEPGYYHLGALNITFTPDEPGHYDLELDGRNAGSVDVEPAESDIQVIAASTADLELIEGEETYVIGSVYQSGNVEGTQEIELTATHNETGETEVVGTQEVTLEPGYYHLGALNISFTPDEPGHYDLELDGRNAGSVDVEPAESNIQVIAATATESEIAYGQETHAIGSIYQAGNIEGTEEIELTATHNETGETEVVGTQEVTLEPGYYHLGALNITFTPDEPGHYDLQLGGLNAGWIDVSDPVVEPTIVDVDGYSTETDPATGNDVVYANDDASVTIDVEADLDLTTVTLLIDSLETTYIVPADATHDAGDTWIADVPFEHLPDDGEYALSVVAVDELDHAGTVDADETLVIDREDPTLSVTLEDVTGDDATIIVESDEPLVDAPEIEVTVEDISTSASTMGDDPSVTIDSSNADNTTFTGTLTFGDESGEYTVDVTGTDRAGNEGTASTDVVHYAFTLEDDVIEIEGLDVQVVLDVVDDVDAAVKAENLALALAESTANANLDDGAHGVGFLQTELPGLLDVHLEGAEIAMAIDEDELPAGFDATDVDLAHYDSTTGEWTAIEDTTIDYGIGDDPYLVGDVSGFSTYGAVITDTTAPTIDSTGPADGHEFDAGTESVTLEFTYEDDLSGIDVSSIELVVDGESQTDSEQTSVDSSGTTHTHQVSDGGSYDVTLHVADEAGNEATETLTFSVADSDDDDADEDDSDEDDADEDDSDEDDADEDDSDEDDSDEDDGTEDDADEDDADEDDADEDDSDEDDGTEDDADEDGADDDDADEDGADDDDADEDDADEDDADEDGADDDDSDDDDETATSDDTDDDDGSSDSLPGFGFTIALFALLAIAMLGLRTRE